MLYEIKPEAPSQNQISACLTVTNKRITIPTGMEKPPGPLLQTWTQRGKCFFTGWLYWPADIEAWLERSLWTVELVSPESSLSYSEKLLSLHIHIGPLFTHFMSHLNRCPLFLYLVPMLSCGLCSSFRDHPVILQSLSFPPSTFLFPPLSNPVCPLLFWTSSLLVLSVHLRR